MKCKMRIDQPNPMGIFGAEPKIDGVEFEDGWMCSKCVTKR